MKLQNQTHKLVKLGFIYALKNPLTDEIFYIGATESSPKDRLNSHYDHFLEYLKGKRNKTKKFEYFENLFPVLAEIELLEIVQNDYLYKKEIEYISKYSKLYTLVNQTIGGEGGDTFSLQEKVDKSRISELISIKASGRVMSESQKQMLSETRLGKNNPMAQNSKMPKCIMFKNEIPLKVFQYPYEITEFFDNLFGSEFHKKHSGRAGNISKGLKQKGKYISSGYSFIRMDQFDELTIQDIVQTLEKSSE